MSHDASSSPAAPVDDASNLGSTDTRTTAAGEALPDATSRPSRRRAQSSQSTAATSTQQQQRRKKKKSRRKRNPGMARKLAFVTHLLKSLDTLVYAELSALYYMECSLFRFILRSVAQYLCLKPRVESFPVYMPATRIHVLLILIPNIICMLLHLFSTPPAGPDYHRGYMHGGLIIDFVGQKPPASRFYYVLADVCILALQFVMLAIHTEREHLRAALKTFRPTVMTDLVRDVMETPTIEELDAEERGVSRDIPGALEANENGDIELRPLRRGSTSDADGAATEAAGGSETRSRANSRGESSGTRSHLSDVMISGNAVLGEYHIMQSIRVAAGGLERTAAQSLRSLGYDATMAALQARRHGVDISARTSQRDRR